MEIRFKAKPEKIHFVDGTFYREQIKVPELKRSHVNMNQARSHKKYGSYANSDLFPAMLARIKREKFPKGFIDLANVPEGVKVDTSKFLAVVSWTE